MNKFTCRPLYWRYTECSFHYQQTFEVYSQTFEKNTSLNNIFLNKILGLTNLIVIKGTAVPQPIAEQTPRHKSRVSNGVAKLN